MQRLRLISSSHSRTRFLLLAWIAVLLLANNGASARFFRTSGKDILDPQGQEYHSKGINLNGWLLPEAYGMAIDNVHNRHLNAKSDIESNIRVLLQNDTDADEFWKTYIDNYVTEQDIQDLAAMGFNSIRLPFNYRLISPMDTPGEFSEEGFQMLDKIIGWCRNAGMSILLDMHSCPGGQSHDPYADPEYKYWLYDENTGVYRERGVQVLWEYNEEYFQATGRTPEFNKARTAEIWQKIAQRYRDEPAILGYELANEPYYYASAGVTDDDLRAFFIQVTAAVRAVDTNHIVFVEGNIFAEEIGGLLPPFDDNMAIAFHRYWRETGYEDGVVQHYLDAREEHSVPFLMTESGENSDPWIYEIRQLMESNNIGWFYWGFKKVDGIALHYEVGIDDDYQYVIDNWRESQPDPALIKKGLMQLAEASKSENCRVQPGYFAAMVDPAFDTEPKPYIDMSLPGIVHAAYYDVGNHGVAYEDTRYKNEEYQGTGWNLGWIYRNGGVDIKYTTDDSDERSMGYHVFAMETEEWMKYTVNVEVPGLYRVQARARSAEGLYGRIGVALSDQDVASPILVERSAESSCTVDVPDGELTWADRYSDTVIYLPKGKQVLILDVMVGGLELSWVEFTLDTPMVDDNIAGEGVQDNTGTNNDEDIPTKETPEESKNLDLTASGGMTVSTLLGSLLMAVGLFVSFSI